MMKSLGFAISFLNSYQDMGFCCDVRIYPIICPTYPTITGGLFKDLSSYKSLTLTTC